MGYKIKEMVSVYEFNETTGKCERHYTLMSPDPQKLQDMIIIDLWDIRNSVNRHRKILLENAEIFSAMHAEESFVTVNVNSTLVKEILGRLYAAYSMLTEPEEMEPLLDDDKFLSYVGEQEYIKLNAIYDKVFGPDRINSGDQITSDYYEGVSK